MWCGARRDDTVEALNLIPNKAESRDLFAIDGGRCQCGRGCGVVNALWEFWTEGSNDRETSLSFHCTCVLSAGIMRVLGACPICQTLSAKYWMRFSAHLNWITTHKSKSTKDILLTLSLCLGCSNNLYMWLYLLLTLAVFERTHRCRGALLFLLLSSPVIVSVSSATQAPYLKSQWPDPWKSLTRKSLHKGASISMTSTQGGRRILEVN